MNIKKLRYLSPDGRDDCPQGVYLAKGAWHQNARINESSFITDAQGSPFGNKSERGKLDIANKGGVIVFPSAYDYSGNKTATAAITDFFSGINKLSEELFRHDPAGTFSVGKFFYGQYTGENGDIFSSESLSINVGIVSTKVLLLLAGELADYLEASSFIIKDLNKGNFYIGDRS